VSSRVLVGYKNTYSASESATWIRIGDGPTGGMSATFVSGSHFCAIPPDFGSFGDMYGKK